MSFYQVKNNYEDYLKNKGMFFLGAGEFTELEGVLSCKPNHVFLVEALAKRCASMRDKCRKYAYIEVCNAVISNKNHLAENFHVYHPLDASSLLAPTEEHIKRYPQTRVVETITTNTYTLDSLLVKYGIAHEDCEVLFMSLQGAELFALEGMTSLLDSGYPKLIALDLYDIPLYKGGATMDSVEEFLDDYEYELKEVWDYYGVFVKDPEIDKVDVVEENDDYDMNALDDYLISVSG